ncbi:DnaJ-like protein [Chloropicon primus]|uniref:DnaJ-like protein n=1 Tax=Chloropicon primus TaxID=1764295 RepID=A0A5B8MSK3_9CHLO|nr:DnaJ-like protein [Chloropicon primus]UPR02951.1 DnaJ-like protein [Chloropicon primus]|eukprot:QDZ23738.1 DnaJ-like protein [Chloropicon primus]
MGLDYYEILSLQRTATTADVQKAYRKLALKHHPDRTSSEDSVAVFGLISEAYDVLCNPKTKGFYDLYGEEGIKYGVTDGKGTKKGGFYACKKTPLETFVEFFGTENPFAALEDLSKSLQSVLGTPVLKPGKKKTIKLPVSLEDIYTGCNKMVENERKILFENGTVKAETKKFNIPISPGCKSGTRYVFDGAGHQVPGCKAGSIVYVVEEEAHPLFERDGADLIFKVQIPLVKSLTGFSIDLQTLDKRTLCIPVTNIVQTGDVLTIEDEGLPTGNGGKGCLVVAFEVLFPKVLSETQKQIIKSGFYLPSATSQAQQKSVDSYLGSFSNATEGWSVGFSK